MARKIASTPTGVTGLYEMHQGLGNIQTAVDIAKVVDLLVDGSSSQDLVQNGGPSAPPLLQSGRPSDVLSLGKTLKTQSAHGFSSGKAPTAGGKRRSRRQTLQKPKKCPRGTRWRFGYDPKVGYPRFHCMKRRKPWQRRCPYHWMAFTGGWSRHTKGPRCIKRAGHSGRHRKR